MRFKYLSISNYFLSQNWLVFLFHKTYIQFLNPILKIKSLHLMSVPVFLVYYNLLKETIKLYSLHATWCISMAPDTNFMYFIKLN